jgi:hypothetical protein
MLVKLQKQIIPLNASNVCSNIGVIFKMSQVSHVIPTRGYN